MIEHGYEALNHVCIYSDIHKTDFYSIHYPTTTGVLTYAYKREIDCMSPECISDIILNLCNIGFDARVGKDENDIANMISLWLPIPKEEEAAYPSGLKNFCFSCFHTQAQVQTFIKVFMENVTGAAALVLTSLLTPQE